MAEKTDLSEWVTFTIAGQLFGLPIACVQDVFKSARITRVPLAAAEVAGVLNLRGRIVTVIDMRRRLGVGHRADGGVPMAIGIEANGESFGLLVDAVGEVLKLPVAAREPNPINLDRKLAALSGGIYRLDGELLVVLEIDRVLDLRADAASTTPGGWAGRDVA
jgi:purine-binding chemotaxis protein CheW